MIQCLIHLVCMLLLPKLLREYITPSRGHAVPSQTPAAPAGRISAQLQPTSPSRLATSAGELLQLSGCVRCVCLFLCLCLCAMVTCVSTYKSDAMSI